MGHHSGVAAGDEAAGSRRVAAAEGGPVSVTVQAVDGLEESATEI